MTTKRRNFLSEDHIYRDLTIVLVAVLIIGPFVEPVFGSTRIDSYLTAGFLLFALYEITRRASDVVIGLVLGVPAVAGGFFNAATPDTPATNIAPTILSALFLGFLTWCILKDVFGGSRISSEQIFGAVCAYLLIGFLFSSIYGFIALVNPDAFAYSDGLGAQISAEHGARDPGIFTYFSFVTMSTLGYGDMSPVSSAARSTAWLQAVLGQLYLAITIAALVGVHIARKRQQ
jgi:hypothetical protein